MWLLFISTLDITPQVIFLMMRISIDDIEQYLFKGISYCESVSMCTLACEAHTLSYTLFTYVYSKTLMEMQIYIISKLLITIF